MSNNVEMVIRKAITDTTFRETLFSDPDTALAEFDLSEEEASKFRGLEPDFFEGDAAELEERISRWGGFAGSGI